MTTDWRAWHRCRTFSLKVRSPLEQRSRGRNSILGTRKGHKGYEGNGAHPRLTRCDLFENGELLWRMGRLQRHDEPPSTLSCSISGGGTWSSAAVTIIASKGEHRGCALALVTKRNSEWKSKVELDSSPT